mmetsp:Transcript_34807/g.42939  ORF Transcript_34807/g.42939 Transcript_34807/m.42939 type:complete len:412 (-) Transcript_34807:322-1557(-)
MYKYIGTHSDKMSKAGDWVDAVENLGFETQLVHAGVNPDKESGAILTPIFQSTTFVQESIDKYLAKGYSYSRTTNPTVKVLEEKIATLEGGVGAAAFSTGMAATVTVMTACLKSGDHCVLTDCSYGGTNRAARVMFSDLGIEFSYVDCTDVEKVKAAIKPNTKLIFTETPANPTLTLNDIEAISKVAKANDPPILHVCDSTFATPLMLKPLELGADMTLHSTTKYYDGHNMTTGGAVACATKELTDKIKFYQNIHGNIMSPMVAFLQLQTVKTMELRVRKQTDNAQKIAEFLETHPAVDVVRYPGLKSFPQRELAEKQHKLHGGMLWFEVKGGTEAGRKLMDSINRPWSLCENLGAIESIITCPSVMTHANMLKEDRLKVGITDGFVRVSCGIEDANDLIKSLKKSLDALL